MSSLITSFLSTGVGVLVGFTGSHQRSQPLSFSRELIEKAHEDENQTNTPQNNCLTTNLPREQPLMMSATVGSVKQKRDAYLIQHFAKPAGAEAANSHSEGHKHNNSQPLDTIEADIGSVLKQPLSERAKTFYDKEKCDQTTALLNSTKPWTKDVNYFQQVHVSSLALLKMAVHARSGGSIEVMGMLTGKIIKNGIVVMDVYPLPVEGTETRVNAQAEGYEFMVQYLDTLKKTGRYENIVGWYHSHPGYGCWLSGIDVSTQSLNQQFQDPYLAIVVDPERTISNGSVEIGAFRTYPEDYHNTNANNNFGSLGSLVSSSAAKRNNQNEKQPTSKVAQEIPEEKIKDFGMHSSKYYSLAINVFRSDLDQSILESLWNEFWINSLSTDVETADAVTRQKFIHDKLIEFNGKVENLKKFDSKAAQAQSSIAFSASSLLGKVSGQLSGFLRRPRFQQSSNSVNASTSSSPNNFSLLSQSQLSPFTKANMLSKMKAKEADTDGSDSEMNDVDSDTDSRIDVEEQSMSIAQRLESPALQEARIRRARKTNSNQSSAKTEATSVDPESAKSASYSGSGESAQGYKNRRAITATDVEDKAAQASRNLMSLKLQEILFLNE